MDSQGAAIAAMLAALVCLSISFYTLKLTSAF
jgi:hypothetical protein